jgi:hypothetical protein
MGADQPAFGVLVFTHNSDYWACVDGENMDKEGVEKPARQRRTGRERFKRGKNVYRVGRQGLRPAPQGVKKEGRRRKRNREEVELGESKRQEWVNQQKNQQGYISNEKIGYEIRDKLARSKGEGK